MVTTKGTKKKVGKAKSTKPPAMKLVNTDKSDSLLFKMISEAAYYRAEKRNFQGGDAHQDWLEAESEILNSLNTRKAG